MGLHIDIESFSEINLTKVGVYKYAEHPSTEVLVVCYAFDDDPVCTWVPREDLPDEVKAHMQCYHDENGGELILGARCPFEVAEHIESGGQLVAHNAGFERVMLNGHPGQAIDFPHTEPEQWKCTAAKAAALSLPRSLEYACKALGTANQKSTSGRGVMLQLCRPRRKQDEPRWTPENAPDKFIHLYEYCIDDVESERDLDNTIPDISKAEQQVWVLDQRINDRGVRVDLDALDNVRTLVKEYKAKLREECKLITGWSPTQTEVLADWIREGHNYPIDNLQAATIDAALRDPECPKKVRRVLKLRRLYAMNAVAKYDAMAKCACDDGRIRGMFMYHGAGTGRWAGRLVQLQNLHRGFIKDPDTAIEAYEDLDLEWLQLLFGENLMKVFVSTIRGMIIPAEDKELLCVDYKAFEGRGLAWLADDQQKLDIYRTHGLVYEDTAARLFGLPRDEEALRAMKKLLPERYLQGKTTELACGYQGWKGALMDMAKLFRVDLTEDHAMVLASQWRDSHPKIVKFWKALETAATAAIGSPGTAFKAGKHIRFVMESPFLYMVLPSGRRIAYYKPEMQGKRGKQITFMGTHTLTRQWTRCDTYGGKLAQNAAEGVTRDILAVGALKLDKAGYETLGTVHDEIITEHVKGAGSLEEMCELMCTNLPWNEGFPIDADGFIAQRYRKE